MLEDTSFIPSGRILNKYPVISKNGNQYEVDVINDWVTCSGYQWKINVFIKTNRRIFPRRMVHTCSMFWNYDNYIGKYKELAIGAVLDYKNSIAEYNKSKQRHENGIRKFNEWDGIIR